MSGAATGSCIPAPVHEGAGAVGPAVDPGAESLAPVRWPVGVVMSRFPLITETFILREVMEMERQGQPVRLIPLVRETPRVVHREALPWVDRALYIPFFSWSVLTANMRVLRRDPVGYARVLGRTLLGVALSPNLLVRVAALLPKSVYLAERLRSEGIRHLHAHFATHPTTAALVAGSLGEVDFSFTVHAHDIFVRRALLEPKLRRARIVRLISDFNRRYLEERYPGAMGNRARVIHVGIDPAGYHDEAGYPDGANEDVPLLLCVAAFKEYKGIPVLIEACARLVQRGVRFRCHLVGDGPLRPQVERSIRELGLDDVVRLHGAVPQDEVTRLLGRAAVLVLPSIVARDGQMEGIPVALMEAMAAGRPVVASSLSGIPELVRHEVNGLLVAPGDAAALGAALERLIEGPALGRALGERGRVTVREEFQLDRCVAQLLAELDRCAPPRDVADDTVATEVRAMAGALGHDGAIGIRRVHQRRDSRVVELVLAGATEPRELVLKAQRARPGESAPAADRARREFETLERLVARFDAAAPTPGGGAGADGKRRLCVPRPIHLDGARASIVMERCSGAPLEELIRARRWGGEGDQVALRRDVADAAEWLDAFHRHSRLDAAAEMYLNGVLEGAADDLLRSEIFGRASADRLLSRLHRLRADSDPTALQVVERHGDFGPVNIFMDSEAVTVIDFEGSRPGLDYQDVTEFLVELEPFLAFPFRPSRRTALRQAFVAQYFADRVPDPAALALCQTAAALAALARDREREREQRARGPGTRMAPRAWRRRRALLRLVGGDR
jgi:colanic acid/amylovoran biosynthesis glycosyltransferase